MANDTTFNTRNLSQAAYLVMNGFEMMSAKRVQRDDQKGPEYRFSFSCYNEKGEDAREVCLRFLSSESSRFDDAVRKVRMVINTRS